MKKTRKATIESKASRNYRWAVQTLILSICMSLMFGFLSQTLLSSMGAIMAIIGICVFIFISVVFDMLGIAVASASEEQFEIWKEKGLPSSTVGLKLCLNSEKVCSFCADVVGDICGTLCGAGGACVVVALTSSLASSTIIMLISVSVSALIAGITIFCKALMKTYALTKSNQIILRLGKLLEKTLYRGKQ